MGPPQTRPGEMEIEKDGVSKGVSSCSGCVTRKRGREREKISCCGCEGTQVRLPVLGSKGVPVNSNAPKGRGELARGTTGEGRMASDSAGKLSSIALQQCPHARVEVYCQ